VASTICSMVAPGLRRSTRSPAPGFVLCRAFGLADRVGPAPRGSLAASLDALTGIAMPCFTAAV